MRLLYRGASDHTALVKRFEDQEIEAALDAGWRLHRAKDDEAEPEEPGSDGPLDAPEAPPAEALSEPEAADDPDATDPPSEGDARPEDPEPPQSTSRRRRR